MPPSLPPNTYAPPPAYTYPTPIIQPLPPIYPPPAPLPYPALPSRDRAQGIPGYARSTHIVPAAYLRSTRYVPLSSLPLPEPGVGVGVEKMEKAERKRVLREVREGMHAMRAMGARRGREGYPRVLWNVVNRYVRGEGEGQGEKGLTLFFAHANGFPKEIFGPTLCHLLSQSQQTNSPAPADIISEVWVWESIQHGDAALINAGRVSALFDWHNNARDILNFLLYFLPSLSPSPATTARGLPTHIPQLPADITRQRLKHGFVGEDERRLVVVGHSYGGCTSALAATIYPALFTALYLVDPVIIEPRGGSWIGEGEGGAVRDGFSTSPAGVDGRGSAREARGKEGEVEEEEDRQKRRENEEAQEKAEAIKYERERTSRPDLALGALGRRDGWDSREQAHALFLSNPFFRAWDPEVLKVYVDCGIYDTWGLDAGSLSSTPSPSPSSSPSSTSTKPHQQTQQTPRYKLKTPPLLEASVFAETHTEHEVFHLLSMLPRSVSLRWCVPGKEGAAQLGFAPVSVGAGEEERREVGEGMGRRVWVRRAGFGEGEETTNVAIGGAGHLIPQEAPQELAQDLGAYLMYMYPRWMKMKMKMTVGGGAGNVDVEAEVGEKQKALL